MNKPEHGNPTIHRIATFLLVVFLIIRSFLALLTVEFPEGGLTLDSTDYIGLSESIRYKGSYSDSEGSSDLRRPPVYPAFLALFQSRVDLHQSGVSLAQLGLGSFTSLVVLWFFMRRDRTASGLVAGWLIAISPNINLWSLTIMSEVLFAFLLILAFTFVVIGLDRSSMKMIYFAGVILGLATLTRPIGLVIVILWVLITVIASIRGWSSSLSISTGMWLFVGSATLILPRITYFGIV
jgi:4-amino-4-deoxy-L-arabinose transferase-like glycosyltransferase